MYLFLFRWCVCLKTTKFCFSSSRLSYSSMILWPNSNIFYKNISLFCIKEFLKKASGTCYSDVRNIADIQKTLICLNTGEINLQILYSFEGWGKCNGCRRGDTIIVYFLKFCKAFNDTLPIHNLFITSVI